MFEVGSKSRLVVGLIVVFVLLITFYFLCSLFFPPLSLPATIALSTCLCIYFISRWQIKPPIYDREFADLRGILSLMPLLGDAFLPFSSWAMEPSALVELLLFVQGLTDATVVECGSGLSTLLIATILKRQEKGHLFSIEEDREWYNLLYRLVKQKGLENYVTLIYAPISTYGESSDGLNWYQTDEIEQALARIEHIDLLLVDGPKNREPFSRYPALPFFVPWITKDTLIVLDDSNRLHEQMVLNRWQEEFPVKVNLVNPSSRGQAKVSFLATPFSE